MFSVLFLVQQWHVSDKNVDYLCFIYMQYQTEIYFNQPLNGYFVGVHRRVVPWYLRNTQFGTNLWTHACLCHRRLISWGKCLPWLSTKTGSTAKLFRLVQSQKYNLWLYPKRFCLDRWQAFTTPRVTSTGYLCLFDYIWYCGQFGSSHWSPWLVLTENWPRDESVPGPNYIRSTCIRVWTHSIPETLVCMSIYLTWGDSSLLAISYHPWVNPSKTDYSLFSSGRMDLGGRQWILNIK